MSLHLGTRITPEEAKQFAQSDIERRVLASLETYRPDLSDPTTPPLMQLIERLHGMQLNLPRYDSATVATARTKALETLLTLPPTASPEHQRLDQILHEIAELVERTDPDTAEAMSEALDAALKDARDGVKAAAPSADDFDAEVLAAVEAEWEASLNEGCCVTAARRPPTAPTPSSATLGPGKTRDGACSIRRRHGKGNDP